MLFWCYLLFLIQYLERRHIWLYQCPLIQHYVSSGRSTRGLRRNCKKREGKLEIFLVLEEGNAKGTFVERGFFYKFSSDVLQRQSSNHTIQVFKNNISRIPKCFCRLYLTQSSPPFFRPKIRGEKSNTQK